MMTEAFAGVIRKYQNQDREAVRNLCYQTAFLENADLFVDGKEILSDLLSLYFTDYEPESCFIAEVQGEVVGYLIGTKNIIRMSQINFFVILRKVFFSGVLLKPKNLRLLYNLLKSFFRGEFWVPSLPKKYQTTFHINIHRDYRGQQFGGELIECFLQYLKQNQKHSVYVSTLSREAKNFFVRQGFNILYYRKRSYLKYRLGKTLNCYVLCREFS